MNENELFIKNLVEVEKLRSEILDLFDKEFLIKYTKNPSELNFKQDEIKISYELKYNQRKSLRNKIFIEKDINILKGVYEELKELIKNENIMLK